MSGKSESGLACHQILSVWFAVFSYVLDRKMTLKPNNVNAIDAKKPALGWSSLLMLWCPEPDSNWHAFRRGILNPVRLPIPPSGLNAFLQLRKEMNFKQQLFSPIFPEVFLVETLIFKRVAAYFYRIFNPLRLPIPPPRLVEAELSTNHFFGSSESAHGKVFASALASSMAVLMPVFGG